MEIQKTNDIVLPGDRNVENFKRVVGKVLNFVENNRRSFEDLVVSLVPKSNNVVHLLVEEKDEFAKLIRGRLDNSDGVAMWDKAVTDSLAGWLEKSDKLIDTLIDFQPKRKEFKAVTLGHPVEIKFAQIPSTSIYHWGVMSVMQEERFSSFYVTNGPKTFTGLLTSFSKKEYPEELKRKLIGYSMKSQVRDDFKDSEITLGDVSSLLSLIKRDIKCVEIEDVEKYLKKFTNRLGVQYKSQSSNLLSDYVEVLGDRIKDESLIELASQSQKKSFNIISEQNGRDETVFGVEALNTTWISNLNLEVRTETNKKKVLRMGVDKITDSYRLILDVYKQVPNSGLISYEIKEPNHILDYVDKVPLTLVLEPGKTIEDVDNGLKITLKALEIASKNNKELFSKDFLKKTKLRDEETLDYIKSIFLERMFDNINSDKKTAPKFNMR